MIQSRAAHFAVFGSDRGSENTNVIRRMTCENSVFDNSRTDHVCSDVFHGQDRCQEI